MHINDFAKSKKMSVEKVKKLISEGTYKAEWVEDDLYVLISEGQARPKRTEVKYSSSPQAVVVTDIDMRFGSMVRFMVKWAIAVIPASIILVIFGFIIYAFFISLFR